MIKNRFLFICLDLILISISISMFAQSSMSKIIAHRGAWISDSIPQNSIASLRRAIQLGCYGSEFDVRMTVDSVLVINHDPHFQGLDIESSTYNELITKKLTNGETIPTLEQIILVGKVQDKTKLIVEIKPSPAGKERSIMLAQKCVATINRLQADQLVEYISFDYDIGLKVIELDKNAKVSYLEGRNYVPLIKLKKDGFAGLDYHIGIYQKHPEYLIQSKELALLTNIWTVNNIDDMNWALKMGIDYITTDKPAVLLNLLKSMKP